MKIFSWWNRKGMNVIFISFGLVIVVVLLKHWGVLPTPILNWKMDIDAIMFIVAGALFLLSILIFAPLYRRFGKKEDKTKGVAKFLYGTKTNKKG